MPPRSKNTEPDAPAVAFSDGVGEDQPTDSVTEEVKEKVDQETEQGFRGTEVDDTPNENYTVSGVLAGKPTPETTVE
jgi:hypothetical protein